MAKKKIGEYITEWMDEFELKDTYEVHRTEFVKEVNTWYLRVYVDKLVDGKYDYMSSDDCEIVSRYLSECLDKEDPITQNYYLEVSSPGMDRPLINQKDFDRFKGSLVDIKLYKALEGKKQFSATLKDHIDDKTIAVDENGNEISLLDEQIAKINLAVVF